MGIRPRQQQPQNRDTEAGKDRPFSGNVERSIEDMERVWVREGDLGEVAVSH